MTALTATRADDFDTVGAVACGTVVAVGFKVDGVVRRTVVGVSATIVVLTDVGDVPEIMRSLGSDKPGFTSGAPNASGSGLSTWVFES